VILLPSAAAAAVAAVFKIEIRMMDNNQKIRH
jgi:hypothetical protein